MRSRSDGAWKRASRKWPELMAHLQARAEEAAEGEAEAPPAAGACSPPLPPLPPSGDDDDADGPPLLCGGASGAAAIELAALVVA
jgi:hypothetical protein